MTETPDKLCLKAEATGKLTFVTPANTLRKTQFAKGQTIVWSNFVCSRHNLNIFHKFVILLLLILC